MAAAFPRLNRSGGRLIVIPASGAESAGGLYACFISGLKAGGRYVPSAAGDAAGEHPRGHPPGRPGDRGRDHGFRPCLPVFFGPLPLPKQRPVKKSCVVWPAFCMGPYFWGLVLMYLTLKSARSGDFLAAGYQKKQKKDRRFFLSPPGNHRGGFRRPCAGHQIIGIIFYGGRALRQFVRRR